MSKSELVNKLAQSLAEKIVELRDAEKRNPEYVEIKEHFLLDGLDEFIDDLNHHGGIYTQHELSLTAEEYWNDVIRVQIDTIGITGGIDLMREVLQALGEIEDNNSYKYESAFISNADGLHGWYN